MSLFPIASDKAQLTTAAVDAGDCYVQGLRLNSLGTLCRAALAGGAQFSNGLLLSNDGQVIYVDATAGLPAGTSFSSGLPLAPTGELCISTGDAVTYSNGLPFVANGALSVAGLSSFSPASLFAAGEPGVWYDPSDMSTMFQDAAGTTPVTAVEQPVGLLLDKSRGLVLGQELVTNGDFSAGTTGWSNTGASAFDVTGGAATVTLGAGGGTAVIFQSVNASAGKVYAVTYTLNSVSGGTFDFRIGGTSGVSRSSPGTYTDIIRTVGSTVNAGAAITAAGVASFSIDNISVRELPGAHASQTTATARPIYRAVPQRLVFDGVDDVQNTTFAASLGSNCTIARAVPGVGASILTSQTVGTTFASNTTHAGLVVINRALTAGETTQLTSFLNSKAGV